MNYLVVVKQYQWAGAILVGIWICKFIHNNNVIDLWYISNPFTWHKRDHEHTIFSLLNHALTNIYGYICILILFFIILPYLDPITPLFCLIYLCQKLPKLIMPLRSTFIPNRNIHGNILTTHEILSTFDKKT